MQAVYIVRSEIHDGCKIIPCILVNADDQPRVKLGIGDSIDITWENDEVAIHIVCFKKGNPPRAKWSIWPEHIGRWIALQIRRAS